jgi:tetratricopeptide (TPR) repeat protein
VFRRALQADPTLAEARVRLARLPAARGQHAEAIAELQRALAAQPANDVRYLALMLLGDEVQAIGRRGEAKEHYEAAAALYPTAQSPLLALGLLAREGGDRRAAIAALDRISRLPADPEARIDPSWAYYLMQGRDADRLMQRLYALTGTEAR